MNKILNLNSIITNRLFVNNPKNLISSKYFILAISNNYSRYTKNTTVESFTDINVNNKNELDSLFKPKTIKPNFDKENIGEELSGKIKKGDIQKLLLDFIKSNSVKSLCDEVGVSAKILENGYDSFRKYCLMSTTLPTDLHVKFVDIINGNGNLTDLFPFFYKHMKEMYPHLVYMDDLKKLSDLREPANWYPDARKLKRKVFYHAGPTNSGKTYSALKKFSLSKSGIYCAPLKLLANEIAVKTNKFSDIDEGICDLITGDDKKYVKEDETDSTHSACTVEMANLNKKYEIAIIDEIQMIKDIQRGWAWTRAFLGLCADEIHLCGDASAIDLFRQLTNVTGDEFTVINYNRLTKITYLEKPLLSLMNVKPGDCIVCFNKTDIFSIANKLRQLGHEVAIIYGAMPPGVKLEQSNRFNDPNDPCKILVSTDAIGMGLNFNIKRIVFSSITKPTLKENGLTEMDYIPKSQALQIAGRAGRFKSPYPEGEVTALRKDDLIMLNKILSEPLEPITKAGLHPSIDQIEMFSFHLPNQPLTNLFDIFLSLCQLDDSKYFMCSIKEMKYLAEIINHIDLPLRARYTFISAPVNTKDAFLCSMFVKYVRSYSKNEALSAEDLCKMIDWPRKTPRNVSEINNLENLLDVFDLYVWLSYRFKDVFTDTDKVKQMRIELDDLVLNGLKELIKSTVVANSSTATKPAESNTNKTEIVEIPEVKVTPLKVKETKISNYNNNNEDSKIIDELLKQKLINKATLDKLRRKIKKESELNIKDLFNE